MHICSIVDYLHQELKRSSYNLDLLLPKFTQLHGGAKENNDNDIALEVSPTLDGLEVLPWTSCDQLSSFITLESHPLFPDNQKKLVYFATVHPTIKFGRAVMAK